ncbi:Beta-amyrin synthase [Hibiscus syriacus]|uniref:Beta-amyrin synthase n=1 Tax=Hibiscus syriacus TaxID=106335 RepID=A0A6A3CKL1_HIBSY|nr:Beta-amyrin synthase [Hibiscus syriacus]
MKQTIPQPKINDIKEMTYEDTTATLRRTIHLVSTLQSEHGHWPSENSGPMYFMPPLVMCLYITGHLNSIFTTEHRKEILRYIYCQQDGGWGLYAGGHHSSMFGTTLNYICMRLLGVEPDGGLDNACERGRKWILDRGGVTYITSWGKTWLAIMGIYEWSGCNPMPPEFWLLPSYFPVHPEDGMKMQSFGSQVWDASFFLQALLASNLSDEIGHTIMKGHNFLKNSQVRDNPPGDFKECLDTFLKDHGHFLIEIMDGKSLIVLQKLLSVAYILQ